LIFFGQSLTIILIVRLRYVAALQRRWRVKPLASGFWHNMDHIDIARRFDAAGIQEDFG